MLSYPIYGCEITSVHSPHLLVHKGVWVRCEGLDAPLITKEDTEMASTGAVELPTIRATGVGQYMLTGLSEAHLERLREALDRVALEDTAGIDLQRAVYDY